MKRILIVTPDPETGETLRLKCELEGFEVVQTILIEEAAANLKTLKPDVCVIDVIGLDDDELKETASLLKEAHKEKSRTVLLMPCDPCIKDLPKFKADQVIKKPYDLNFFSKSIRDLLRI
jgi:DNA-binding response OmpR family regulator